MLVKFTCGCVGIPPRPDSEVIGSPVILVDCEDGGLCFARRRVHPENTPLSETRERKIFDQISSLIADGYRFREVKKLFGVVDSE